VIYNGETCQYGRHILYVGHDETGKYHTKLDNSPWRPVDFSFEVGLEIPPNRAYAKQLILEMVKLDHPYARQEGPIAWEPAGNAAIVL
jgi:hypothetical protein